MMKRKTIIALSLLTLLLVACKDNKVDPADARLVNEVKAIDNFIAANVKDYVVYSNLGLRLAIHHFGNEAPPHEGQTVKVVYTGRLFSDNTVFATGVIEDKVENISVEGLKICIASMLKGSAATIYMPSVYGFGTNGTTNVPPNATLVYDVVLEGVTKTTEEQTQFNTDTAFIHTYINDTIKNVKLHPSGIWYRIDSEGTGNSPKPYDYVSFQYKGIIMSNGSVFQNSSIAHQYAFDLIDGLKIGIPMMREGGKATFYIPSGMAYGKSGVSGSVPVNANLKFEIQLNSISK